MLFPTFTFAVFFAAVYPVAWWLAASRRRRAWKFFVLGASWFFYGWWDWRFVTLIILSTGVNALAGRAIAGREGRARRAVLTAAVAFNIGLLGWFKYYGFFVESVNAGVAALGLVTVLPLMDIILPVGISFFTFQALSYVVDIYRDEVEPVPLLDFAVYLAFFPQLVAGPIVRASEFLPQLARRRRLPAEDVGRAARLIMGGLFKKMVVSGFLATAIVDPVFAVPSQHSSLELLLAVYAYAVQIYADFSAYSDIAIGVALLLGFRFPDNFDRPYVAISVQDFWRRWHMTLSRWLRDYLYIPLGGSRAGTWRTYRNLMITMALGGLWHGAALNFIAWGVLHGLGLMIERATGLQRRSPSGIMVPIRAIITFHFVCVGWVLFRAASFEQAGVIFDRLLTAPGPAPIVTPWVVLVVAGALAAQWIPRDLGRRFAAGFDRLPLAVQGAAVAVAIFLSAQLGPEGVAPFIYFRF